MSYTNFQKRMSIRGGSIKNEQIHNAQLLLDSKIQNDPSYKEDVEILDKGIMNLRINNYKIVQGTTPQMDIQASFTEEVMFGLGDVIFYEGGYWLCVEAHDADSIYMQGKIEECNYYLKWQNPKTLEIIGRWCSIRNPYSSGIDDGKVVSVEASKYRIKMPHDEETKLFRAGTQGGTRFLIDTQGGGEPMPYVIIEYDPVTRRYVAKDEGFLIINLKSDQIQEGDNATLMIANYKEPGTPPTPSVGSCSITYSGEAVLRQSGSAKTFTAVFKDSDGNAITTITPQWQIIPADLVNSHQIVILSQSGSEIRLQATNSAVVGDVLTLKMSADDLEHGYYEYEITVEVVDLY